MGTPAADLFGGDIHRGGGVRIPHNPPTPKEVSDWIGSELQISQGALAGERFPVLDWQRSFLDDALADGVQQAGLTVARGNGKSTLIAALASAFITGPLQQPRAEVPVVAASYAQARIIFEHVRSFVDGKLLPRSLWRVTDSLNWSLIEHRPSGARLRVMSSDPRRAHGLAPALCIADEPAQWSVGDGERMFAALVTSMGKIPGARLIALGTKPSNGAHWFNRLLTTDAPGVVSHVYSAPMDCKIDDEKAWEAANPSLSIMPTLWDAIRLEAAQAAQNPAMLPAFRALRLNQGVDDADTVQRLVEREDWMRCCILEAEARGQTIWGIDLGGSAAFSAVACYWPATGRIDVIAECGREPALHARGIADGVGTLYEQAAAAGQLHVSKSRVPQVADLVERALDLWGNPEAVVCDRWRIPELRDAGERLLSGTVPVARGQGFKDGSDDVRRFRAAVKVGHVIPAGPLVLLDSALSGAVVTLDPAGNAKLSKSPGHTRCKAPDDVAAAAILAVGHASRVVESQPIAEQCAYKVLG